MAPWFNTEKADAQAEEEKLSNLTHETIHFLKCVN